MLAWLMHSHIFEPFCFKLGMMMQWPWHWFKVTGFWGNFYVICLRVDVSYSGWPHDPHIHLTSTDEYWGEPCWDDISQKKRIGKNTRKQQQKSVTVDMHSVTDFFQTLYDKAPLNIFIQAWMTMTFIQGHGVIFFHLEVKTSMFTFMLIC